MTLPLLCHADICKNDAAGYGGAIFAGGNVSGFCPPANFQPSPSAYREPSFGHGTLDILNATHAYWQWHRNQVQAKLAKNNMPGSVALSALQD